MRQNASLLGRSAARKSRWTPNSAVNTEWSKKAACEVWQSRHEGMSGRERTKEFFFVIIGDQ